MLGARLFCGLFGQEYFGRNMAVGQGGPGFQADNRRSVGSGSACADSSLTQLSGHSETAIVPTIPSSSWTRQISWNVPAVSKV